MLLELLLQGNVIEYVPGNLGIRMAAMFGFVTIENYIVNVSNRIFETRLYNLYKIYHGKEYNNRVQLYKDIESDPVLFRQNI